jgi:hypothetical protein
MGQPLRILLQATTIPHDNDWTIERFSLLREYLSSLRDANGDRFIEVMARNREVTAVGDDAVLSQLDHRDVDELWLFAVDPGNGLSTKDCESITRFRQRGGGILATRDHQDLGSSICTIGGVGAAHFFHSQHLDPDESQRTPDDQETPSISWPNYHSGNNGDYQRISAVEPVHELLRYPASSSGLIEFFPAPLMKAPLECPSLNGMLGSLRPARARQLVVPSISRWLLREAGTRMETTSAAP